jgi:hypothetical protein
MVEANDYITIATKLPQDDQKAADITSFLTDELDKKHALASKALEERIVELKKLKGQLSVICQEYSRIEEQEQPKLKDIPVFATSAKTLLNNQLNLIKAVEADIARHEKEIELQDYSKQLKIKSMLMLFDMPNV